MLISHHGHLTYAVTATKFCVADQLCER